ncbi:hypothetical protein B0H13DRAFT_2467316 [Mycena leptocephala]|nr:hypothetical protein B0H13DRAFT_2467316 [Mycena leptocephala]
MPIFQANLLYNAHAWSRASDELNALFNASAIGNKPAESTVSPGFHGSGDPGLFVSIHPQRKCTGLKADVCAPLRSNGLSLRIKQAELSWKIIRPSLECTLTTLPYDSYDAFYEIPFTMMTYIPLAVVATLPLLRSVVASPILMGGGIGAGATVTVTITPLSIASPSSGGIGISSILSAAAAAVSAPANSAVNIVPGTVSSAVPVVSSAVAAIPVVVSGAASAASAAFSGVLAAPSSVINPPVALVSSLAPVPSSVIESVVAGVSASVISPAASFVGAVASPVTPIPSGGISGAVAAANGVAASASAVGNGALISAAAAPSAINSAAVATVSSATISTAAILANATQSLDLLAYYIKNMVMPVYALKFGIRNTANQLDRIVSTVVTALKSLSKITDTLTQDQLDGVVASISALQTAINQLNLNGCPADIAATLKPLIDALSPLTTIPSFAIQTRFTIALLLSL